MKTTYNDNDDGEEEDDDDKVIIIAPLECYGFRWPCFKVLKHREMRVKLIR